ncbi:uncharacterized protein PpBr36_11357 [Pyricularia pennisetigena]|uniref:uncharacterized protein n=1 Tax=Pyricularia pennisetigena TaxID=1578925 RepID=UPI00114E628C|nr:uncharacterized protein PpBr36_11357 [Pyricularia pennisetigena]TLS20373.1 hypothetical protein PpBr36_11357 [Pyricularia pennisetigena]
MSLCQIWETTLKIPPVCKRCAKKSSLLITGPENPNGNAGRPYYKCIACNRFFTFADDRGTKLDSPLCDCREPSRLQLNGRDRTPAFGLHCVCKYGECDFYRVIVGKDGNQLCVLDDVVRAVLIERMII